MSINEDSSDRIEIESVTFASHVGLKQPANTIPQLAWLANPDGEIHW
jgi:hypothetical protein